jgi:Hg(II)-responsive transcriptional regulator
MALTVSKFARAAGVGVETVRFYERRGLLEQPARKGAGYRVYSESALLRIRFIRRAQELGFTLNEIRDLIALEQDALQKCDVVRDRAVVKIAAIERKIDDLTRMKAALEGLYEACPGDQPIQDCPLMSCLRDSGQQPGTGHAPQCTADHSAACPAA